MTGRAMWLAGTIAAALLFQQLPGEAQVPSARMEKGGGAPAYPFFVGPQTFDVLHYTLDISLAMVDERLSGCSHMTMVLTAPADSVRLNQAALTLDSILVNGGRSGWRSDPSTETFAAALNGVRSAGDTLRIDIYYRRFPGITRPSSRRGYYFFPDTIGIPANLGYTMAEPSDARFWMPCYDQPWDKASAEINVTVPSGYVAGSNGTLVATTVNGDGTVTWHWREDHEIASYLMCVTCSRFSVSSVPYIRAPGDTVLIQYYVWQPDSAVTAAYLPTVRAMVAALSNLYGPYPFDKYGMTSVIPFSYGGMEHQTLTTLNRYLQTDQDVVVHELAHQWWGDLVTCGTWADVWLNESFATYTEALWQEQLGGAPALKSFMTNNLLHLYYGSWQGAVYDPVSQGFNLFDDVVYSKGAWALHTLRGVVGDPAFFNILAAWRAKYAGRSAVTSEFNEVANSVTGTNLSWFFNEWIYGSGWPRYSTSFTWVPDTLALVVTQSQDVSWPTYKMPLHVRAFHGSRDTTFTVWDSLRTQRIPVPLAFAPDSLVLDPDQWVLKEMVQQPNSTDGGTKVASQFRLDQNFPNPFNPTTMIEFEVPGQEFVTLEVFDILGRKVTTLINGIREGGVSTALFDGSQLASGIYLYRLKAGPHVAVKKMLLLR